MHYKFEGLNETDIINIEDNNNGILTCKGCTDLMMLDCRYTVTSPRRPTSQMEKIDMGTNILITNVDVDKYEVLVKQENFIKSKEKELKSRVQEEKGIVRDQTKTGDISSLYFKTGKNNK